jgi:photoactive yellow protein
MKPAIQFDSPELPYWLASSTAADIESLDFGVIGFDDACIAKIYNAHESKAAGLSPDRVLGQHFFDLVAPCMNNPMVAQRFRDAQASELPLDASLDYVLTLRMRPTKVKLRLIAVPHTGLRYVVVQRRLV